MDVLAEAGSLLELEDVSLSLRVPKGVLDMIAPVAPFTGLGTGVSERVPLRAAVIRATAF